jgi:DNA-binding transcriptional ArsR family regulator
MVDRLARGPATLSELAEPMDMTLTAVTQHLRILEASGLVHSYKQGRTRHCRLRIAAMVRAPKSPSDEMSADAAGIIVI